LKKEHRGSDFLEIFVAFMEYLNFTRITLIIEAFLRFFDLPLSNVRIMKASTVIYTSVLVKVLKKKKECTIYMQYYYHDIYNVD
jgi:hypothetical protein